MKESNGIRIVFVLSTLLLIGFVWLLMKQYRSAPPLTAKTQNIYISKGYAASVKFPKVRFVYGSDWLVRESGSAGGNGDGAYDNVRVSKEQYNIDINQELIAGRSVCQFEDSIKLNEFSDDVPISKYSQTDSQLGKLRYFLDPLNEDTTVHMYTFCVKEGDAYVLPSIGSISLSTPVNQNETLFQEALGIIRSITSIK